MSSLRRSEKFAQHCSEATKGTSGLQLKLRKKNSRVFINFAGVFFYEFKDISYLGRVLKYKALSLKYLNVDKYFKKLTNLSKTKNNIVAYKFFIKIIK